MACDALKKQIAEAEKSLRKEKASEFIIIDTVIEMSRGDTTMCDGCDQYTNCFPDS